MRSLVTYALTRIGILATTGVIAFASFMPETPIYRSQTIAEESKNEMRCHGQGDTPLTALLDYTANCVERNQIKGCTEIPFEIRPDGSGFIIFSSSTTPTNKVSNDICDKFLSGEKKQQYF